MTDVGAHHGLFKNTGLHVDDTGGPGRPVVLIHGWPLSGASWSEQVPVLHEAGFRVVTYDRRGFGRSEKPLLGYQYGTLSEDLHSLVTELDLHDATLIGFSMGGGEVARYLTTFGPERIRSAVFASSVTPFLMQTSDNPDGPLTTMAAAKMTASLTSEPDAFYDAFTKKLFSARMHLKVTEGQRQEALAQCRQADKKAALACMTAFGSTDFRNDLATVTVPTLVVHGDADAIAPFEGAGQRTHAAIPHSQFHLLAGAPHGCHISHAEAWNQTILAFLA